MRVLGKMRHGIQGRLPKQKGSICEAHDPFILSPLLWHVPIFIVYLTSHKPAPPSLPPSPFSSLPAYTNTHHVVE